jgi:Zn-dependent alcohol dehydrogenase
MPKFKIIGSKKIDGKEPGSTITIEDLDKIITLTKAGHITAISKKENLKKVKKAFDQDLKKDEVK